VVDRVGRKDCECLGPCLMNICDRGVDGDAGGGSDGWSIGAALGYLVGGDRAFGTVAFKTSHGCFRVDDSNGTTLPVDA
jgi:hypothetical protein